MEEDKKSKKENLEGVIIKWSDEVNSQNSKKINFHNIKELAKPTSIVYNDQLLDVIFYNGQELR